MVFSEKVILFGRLPECHVQFKGTTTESRLHAIIYVLEQYNAIAIVDVGSENGIIMKQRSVTSKPLVNSTKGDRNVILLDLWESSELVMGTHIVNIAH